MANELKKVGLIFTQEGAVDFKKTLQDVNLELNKNYNQFKLTQAQWDKTTSSTEKLKVQQEYLQNAFEAQSDKVSILKMQLAELEGAENKNTTAIKKKRAELVNAELKLENYKNKIKEVEQKLTSFGKKLEETGEKVEKIGGNIEKAGKKLSAFSAATSAALIASAKSAIDFESDFTGVEKTVDGTAEQMERLKQGIRDMAKEIPSTTTEISAVAEAAGQLGIQTDDILSFTRVMIDLGNSTNLSAEEAASSLAKFANITKMSAKDYDKLGSTIVALGNNFATTEADIVAMATRLAATGELAGLSQSQILSLATAMSSVGIEAEAGGSAMSKLLKKMQVATETGSKDLKEFAQVAGMSASDFKKAYQKDAVGALSAFISGLNDTKRNGKSAIAILDDMGLKEVRLSNTILSLANASDVMTKAVKLGNDAWEDNTALSNEANKRYGTLKSKIQIAINKFKDLAITFGNKLLPTIDKGINYIEKLTKKVDNLSDKDIEFIVNIAKTVAAIGPLLIIVGKINSAGGTALKTIGTITQAIGVMKGNVTSGSVAVNVLASVFTKLLSPAGLATTAILAAGAALVYFATKESESYKESKRVAEQMANERKALDDYNKSVDDAANADLARIDSVSRLKDELAQLVDENGKVDEKNRGRVSFILNEMNEALGTEYKLNGNIVESYKDIQKEIDSTIEKERARIKLNADKEKYDEAVRKNEEYTNKAAERLQAITDKGLTPEEVAAGVKEYNDVLKEINEYNRTHRQGAGITDEQRALQNRANDIKGKLGVQTQEQVKELENYYNAYQDSLYTVKVTTEAKKKYEQEYADFVEGNYKKINSTVTDNTEEYCKKSLEEIKNFIGEEKKNLDTYKTIYNENGDEVSKARIEQAEANTRALAQELANRTSTVELLGTAETEAWKALATNNYNVYQEQLSKMTPEMQKKISDVTGVIYQETPDVSSATEFMTNEILSRLDKDKEFRKEALDDMYSFLNGLSNSDLRELLKAAGVEDVDKVMQGIRDGNLAEEEGKNILTRLNTGLSSNAFQGSLFKTAAGIAQGIASRLSVKFNIGGVGEAFKSITGFINGSHKLGLDYVPKDDYIAKLHKGERVLTAQENKEYTEAEELAKRQRQGSNFANTQTIDYEQLASACNSGNAKIEALLMKLIEITGKQKIFLDSGVLVGETVVQMDEELGKLSDKKARGS